MSVATTKRLLAVYIVLIFLLPGCEAMDPVAELYRTRNLFNSIPQDGKAKNEKDKKKSKKTPAGLFVINLDEYVLRRDRAAHKKVLALDRVLDANRPSSERKEFRHELLDELMEASDAIFEKHVIEIKMSEDVRGIIADSIITVTTGIVPLLGGERIKNILSGSASMISGVDSHIHKRVYNAYVALAIIQAMREKRKDIASEIDGKRGTSITEYPLSRGLRRVQEYHRSGSFVRGVELLTERGEEKKEKKAEDGESGENANAQPPAEVGSFKITLSDTGSITLSWTNPPDGDLKGVLISRWDDRIDAVENYLNNCQGNNKATAPYVSKLDYVVESKNRDEEAYYESKGLSPGKEYLFAAWAFDESDNYSKPVVLRFRKH
jgi:hypothetical protein